MIRSICLKALPLSLLCLVTAVGTLLGRPPTPSGPAAEELTLFRGSQRLSDTAVARERVLAIIELLTARQERGIAFNNDNVTAHIDGGTCSAMSLDFAMVYSQARKAMDGDAGALHAFLEGLGARYAASDAEMACRQAAFNTIEVVRHAGDVDFALNKLQSLAHLYGLHVDQAFPPLDIREDGFVALLHQQMAEWPAGLYVARLLMPADNAKLEVKGHTVVYAHEGPYGYFYDPNTGLFLLPAPSAQRLYRHLRLTFLVYGVYQVRFYLLERY